MLKRKACLLPAIIVFIVVIVVLSAVPSVSDATPSKIYGFVTWSTGAPVSGATVVIKNLNQSSRVMETKTDANGKYEFKPGLFSNEPDSFARTGDAINITVTYDGTSGTTYGYAQFVLGNDTGTYYQKQIDISMAPLSPGNGSENGSGIGIYFWLLIVVVAVALIGVVYLVLRGKKRKGGR